MDDTLAKAIDDLVEKRTFGLDALEAIKGLRDRATASDAKIVDMTKRLETSHLEYAAVQRELNKTRAERDAWIKREDEITAREARVRELEVREAVSTAKAATYQEVFGTVFRNVTVRESTLKTIPTQVQQPNGYPMTVNTTESQSVERTSA